MRLVAIALAALLAVPFVLAHSPEDLPIAHAPESCGPFSSPPLVIPSFDGTPLAASIYVPANATNGTLPLILKGHGYPNQRERPNANLQALVDAGYMVLVWDERGFGQSGGKVHLLAPEYEGRDVLALIDYVAATPPWSGYLSRGAGGNPVVGLAGGSYGGGIQWSALVADRLLGRSPTDTTPPNLIDALVPEITWNSLSQSLVPGGVPKLFIASLLLGTGEVSSRVGGVPPPGDGFCPNTGGQDGLLDAYLSTFVPGRESPETRAFLDHRSFARWESELVGKIPPTLLVQGLRDTLFPPNEAVATFEAIRHQTEAKLLLFPTGHGWSGAPPEVQRDVRSWFNHTLRGAPLPTHLAGNDVGYASDGRLAPSWGSDFVYTSWDAATANEVALPLAGGGLLATLPVPSSYADVTFFQGQVDDQKEPGRAPNVDAPGTAVTWDFTVGSAGVVIVGTPRLSVEVFTTTDDLFLFGKLYDVAPDGSASVLYHQVMAKRVEGQAFEAGTLVTFDLATLSTTLEPGHKLRVALATSDAMHAASRAPGTTFLLGGSLALPVGSGSFV